MSKILQEAPAGVVDACQDVLWGFLEDRAPTCDPQLLLTPAALTLAEAVALEALGLLEEEAGSSSDLLFAPLTETDLFRPLAPLMAPLLHFLRARLLGQAPVLRLAAEAPNPAYVLLLLAVQALDVARQTNPEALRECWRRLGTDPVAARVPAGDLAAGLADGADVDNAAFFRDELRKALSRAVPVSAAHAADDGSVVLALELGARPDLADLIRQVGDSPRIDAGDAAMVTWGGFGGLEESLLRLEAAWSWPVRTDVAIALDVDVYGSELQRIADSPHLWLTDAAALADADGEQEVAGLRVPVAAGVITGLLKQLAARRTPH